LIIFKFSSIEEKKSTGCDCGSFATESTGGLSSAHEGAAGEEEKVGGWVDWEDWEERKKTNETMRERRVFFIFRVKREEERQRWSSCWLPA
jgi:hypothetical protein